MVASKKKSATVEHIKESQAPKLLAGDLTPEVVNGWKIACERHFWKVSLSEELQVSTVASRMDDPRFTVWYNAHRERLDALPFEEFIAEVRSTYLPKDWDSNIRDEVMGARQNDKPFWDWANEVQEKAAVISNMPNALSEALLKQLIQAGVNPRLKKKMNSSRNQADLAGRELFSQWLLGVKDIDEELQEEDERVAAAVEKIVAENKATYGVTKGKPLQARTNAQTNAVKTSTGGTGRTPGPSLPKLTTEERLLLQKHRGCFKCRLPNQNHITANCPNEFPDPTTYTPITEVR
ncbi:hypothetical protein B0H21DRAFT_702481, partial [Amylocystis lapponica]